MNEPKLHYTSVEIMHTVNDLKRMQLELLAMMKAMQNRKAPGGGEWMDRVDVMDMLKISRQTLYRYKKEGWLVPHKMGGKEFYHRPEVDGMLLMRSKN